MRCEELRRDSIPALHLISIGAQLDGSYFYESTTAFPVGIAIGAGG